MRIDGVVITHSFRISETTREARIGTRYLEVRENYDRRKEAEKRMYVNAFIYETL